MLTLVGDAPPAGIAPAKLSPLGRMVCLGTKVIAAQYRGS